MNFSPQKLFSYFRESKEELKKVTWPSRKEAMRHTLIVIGITAAVAIFLGLVDYALSTGLNQLIPS